MPCKSCGVKFGLFMEDAGAVFCVACHPTGVSNLLSPQENFQKIKDIDFPNVKNIVFLETKDER